MWFLKLSVIQVFCVKFITLTAISHVDKIFEVFSARSLVRFFEFNSGGWNLTEDCAKRLFQYLEGLQGDMLWAIKLLDASGYYDGGIFEGDELRLVDPEQCWRLNIKVKEVFWANQPFYVNDSVVPFEVKPVVGNYHVSVESSVFERQNIYQSVCVPESCTNEDLMQILSYNYIPNAKYNRFIKHVDLIDVRILKPSFDFYEDSHFVAFCILTISMLILLTCSSICSIRRTKTLNFTEEVDYYDGHPSLSVKGRINPQVVRRLSQEKAKIPPVIHKEANSDDTNSHTYSKPYTADVICKDDDGSYTNVKMGANDQQMTISNFSANNHVNLVKVKKIDTDNMISLDIISANCYNAFVLQQRKNEALKESSYSSKCKRLCKLLSWGHQFSTLDYNVIDLDNKVDIEIDCLHGIRFLSTCWIIFIHTCYVLVHVSDNKLFRIQMINSSWLTGFLLRNGSFAMDSYFFLSGIIMYQFFHGTVYIACSESFYRVLHQMIYFLSVILFKLLRLLVPFMTILLLLKITTQYFGEISVVEIPSNDDMCEQTMWRNLLFIDIFFPLDQRCMIWSWFLSVEAYFFIAATLLLLLSQNHPHFAITLFTSFFISSFFTTALIKNSGEPVNSLLKNSSDPLTTIIDLNNDLAETNILYDQPWTRISPYIIGIMFSCFLCKIKGKTNVGIFGAFTGWLLSISLTILIMLGPTYIQSDIDFRIVSFFSSFSHGIWALILSWIVFATISNYAGFIGSFLSSRVFYPLSKTSYCALLVHPLVIRYMLMSGNVKLHLSNEIILLLFTGFTVVSYLTAFVLYVVFESPILSLLKMMYQRDKRYE